MAFHDVLFPVDVALGAGGGPERRTEIVTLGSGYEERNAVWAHSRRHYDAGYGVRTLDQLHAVIAFFEARNGRLHGFRWRDRADCRSCPPLTAISAGDQLLGSGNAVTSQFQLIKTYTSGGADYRRVIKKPVTGSVLCAIDGTPTNAFSLDETTGIVTFDVPPPDGAAVSAGFQFDVPVRFDTDRLEINLSHFEAGEIPSIPLVEIRI